MAHLKIDRVKLSVATNCVNFENETAVSETPVVKLQGMWDMTPRRLFSSYWRCERLQCFHVLSKTLDVSKRRKVRTHRHNITSQNKLIFSNADVRNSDILVFRAFVWCAVSHILPEEGDAACLRSSGFWGTFAELRKMAVRFVMSVCVPVHQHGITRLPLDGFSWNLVYEYFFGNLSRDLISIKIWQE
jgi:hypothetical protein